MISENNILSCSLFAPATDFKVKLIVMYDEIKVDKKTYFGDSVHKKWRIKLRDNFVDFGVTPFNIGDGRDRSDCDSKTIIANLVYLFIYNIVKNLQFFFS